MTQKTIFLYILTTTEPNRVRVGITTNVNKRLAELQAENPEPLTVYATLELQDRAKATSLLQRLERKLILKRRGEWFEVEPMLVKILAGTFKENPIAVIRQKKRDDREKEEKEWFEAGKSAFWLGEAKDQYPRLGEPNSRLRSRAKLYWREGWMHAAMSQQREKEE